MRQKKLVYYGKKCLIFLISVFILSVAVFYVARLAPGDPLISYYGDRTEKMSPEEREWAMEKLGLNEPISVQYVKWVKNAFHGEFGISFKYKQDVVEVIGGRIGNTLVLGGIGFIIMFAGALLWESCVPGTKTGWQTGSCVSWEPYPAVFLSSGWLWS